MKMRLLNMVGCVAFMQCTLWAAEPGTAAKKWEVGTPIVTYWAGPGMNAATATQMALGGFNLVWCTEKELDVAQKHGLRAQLQDGLLNPATLGNPGQREKLDALIARVRKHPAMYAYFITDEPNATNFPGLGKLVGYLRERDPAHLAYINLFPTYANNQQLGNTGDTVTAYKAHLRQYVDVVKPDLISYDHYQFSVKGDNPDYFLNLALIRRAALDAKLPFLNIVQACTWTPVMRVPNGDEMRYLIYTSLAYGAQGISYYVYHAAGHTGGIAAADGTPTPLYSVLQTLNPEFVAIAMELQPLRSLGVYHAGMLPPGAVALPENGAFKLAPPVSPLSYTPPEHVRGVLIGYFGASENQPTSVVVVNLDYKSELAVGVRGPGVLEVFDATSSRWAGANGDLAQLKLPRGGGKLVRVKR